MHGITFSSKWVDPLIPTLASPRSSSSSLTPFLCSYGPVTWDGARILLASILLLLEAGFTTNEVNGSNVKSTLRFDISPRGNVLFSHLFMFSDLLSLTSRPSSHDHKTDTQRSGMKIVGAKNAVQPVFVVTANRESFLTDSRVDHRLHFQTEHMRPRKKALC